MGASTIFPQTLTADGTVTITVKPGRYLLKLSGNFGGGTVSLTHDGVALDNGTFTAAATKIIELSAGVFVLTLAGSGGAALVANFAGTMGSAASQA